MKIRPVEFQSFHEYEQTNGRAGGHTWRS